MNEKQIEVRLRVKEGTKIYKYIKDNEQRTTIVSKIIIEALENYIDIINGNKNISEDGSLINTPEQLDIKEIKSLMKEVIRVNKRLENFIIDDLLEQRKNKA